VTYLLSIKRFLLEELLFFCCRQFLFICLIWVTNRSRHISGAVWAIISLRNSWCLPLRYKRLCIHCLLGWG